MFGIFLSVGIIPKNSNADSTNFNEDSNVLTAIAPRLYPGVKSCIADLNAIRAASIASIELSACSVNALTFSNPASN